MKKLLSAAVLVSVFLSCQVSFAEDVELTPKELVIKQIIAENYEYNVAGMKRAITNGNVKMVELYLKAGFDPNMTYLKIPMLFYAISQNQLTVSEKLINAGAIVNSQVGSRTALKEAIATKNIDLVNLLIRNGANVNAKTGETPLCYALKKKNSQAVTSLIKHGAAVDEEALKYALKIKDNTVKNLVLNTYKKQ